MYAEIYLLFLGFTSNKECNKLESKFIPDEIGDRPDEENASDVDFNYPSLDWPIKYRLENQSKVKPEIHIPNEISFVARSTVFNIILFILDLILRPIFSHGVRLKHFFPRLLSSMKATQNAQIDAEENP